jgi:PTS system cellobiose-specific IIB component
MLNIMLVCSAGMSTSLLVSKMNRVAKEKSLDVNVFAVAEADVKNNMDKADIMLLGPQVRYLLPKMKELMKTREVPVDVINTMDYGTMNGEKVLEHALGMSSER